MSSIGGALASAETGGAADIAHGVPIESAERGAGLGFGSAVGRGVASAITAGTLFIVFAFLINFIFDAWFRFAGFNLVIFGNIESIGDMRNWGMMLYMLIKGPILVLALVIGSLTLEKNHVAIRLFFSILLVFYAISLLPQILQGYFALATVDLIIFMLFVIQILKGPSREEYTTLVIWWLMVYGLAELAVNTGNWGAMIHLTFIVVFYLVQSSQYRQEDINFRTNFIVLLLFDFFLVAMLQLLPRVGDFSFAALPILTLGVTFMIERYEKTWFSTFTLFFILIGSILLMGWGAVSAMAAEGNILNPVDYGSDESSLRWRFAKFWDFWDLLENRTTESIETAAGARYVGRVDANSKKRLGVYLEGVSKNAKVYYPGEEIILYATLVAENFDSRSDAVYEVINANVSCKAEMDEVDPFFGSIYPYNEFTIDSYETATVGCELGVLEPGNYEVTFSAKFNFPAQAYMRRYFVAKERIDNLRRNQEISNDLDILKRNEIDESDWEPLNSVGPVQIGIVDRVPVLFKLPADIQDKPFKTIFWVELENTWEGLIHRVDDLRIYMPAGVYLEDGKCNPFRMEPYPSTDKEYEGYTMYRFNSRLVDNAKLRDVAEKLEQHCGLVIEDRSALLDPGEVTPRVFIIEADYIFNLEEKFKITVKEELQ